MSPLVRAAIAAAVLAALAAAVDRGFQPRALAGSESRAHTAQAAPLAKPCPPDTLLDNQVCIPVPGLEPDARAADARQNWQVYDRVPRRPERPTDYQRYQLPIEEPDSVLPSSFVSDDQLRGDALLVGARFGAPVAHAPLEGQRGPASVLFTGELVGRTVVTEHRIQRRGREQVYLSIFGNLNSADTKAGAELPAGALLGKVGSSATGHVVGLHLEIRLVREGVDARELERDDFRDRAKTIACDARNVLSLRSPG